MKNIILDTDLGGDADDVFALLFALNSPEFHIELIVTSDECESNRARYTQEFLKLTKRDIPVVAGMDVGNRKLYIVDEQIKDKEQPVSTNFLEEIKKVVDKNELTHYVCLGPQSNLCKFIKEYPELKDKIEILFMGGAINYRIPDCAEHNVKYDVQAAIDVFHSDWNKKYVLSDITFHPETKVDESTDFYKELKASDKEHLQYIIESIRLLFEKLTPDTYMHDPLTLAYLIDENIIEFETKKLSISNEGIMSLDPQGQDVIVSKSANYDLFWNLFRKRILM